MVDGNDANHVGTLDPTPPTRPTLEERAFMPPPTPGSDAGRPPIILATAKVRYGEPYAEPLHAVVLESAKEEDITADSLM